MSSTARLDLNRLSQLSTHAAWRRWATCNQTAAKAYHHRNRSPENTCSPKMNERCSLLRLSPRHCHWFQFSPALAKASSVPASGDRDLQISSRHSSSSSQFHWRRSRVANPRTRRARSFAWECGESEMDQFEGTDDEEHTAPSSVSRHTRYRGFLGHRRKGRLYTKVYHITYGGDNNCFDGFFFRKISCPPARMISDRLENEKRIRIRYLKIPADIKIFPRPPACFHTSGATRMETNKRFA